MQQGEPQKYPHDETLSAFLTEKHYTNVLINTTYITVD